MISLILIGYLNSIGKVLKNIRRQIAFFSGPNIDNMKKKEEKNIFQFGKEISNKFFLNAMLNLFIFIILSLQGKTCKI